MIEGIFGAEEAKRHQLHCRFPKGDNRIRFGKIRSITWNLKVLNRFGPDPARIRPIRIAHFLDLRRRKRHG